MATLKQQWVLGPYRLLNVVGKGGMGDVWKAQHTSQNYVAAIKIINENQHNNEQFQQAFRREVEAVAKLNHPNICQVLDYGEVSAQTSKLSGGALKEDTSWLAMAYCDQGTLDAYQPMLSWPEIRSCLVQILKGLAHAHARGVIHRDIKPQNILVTTRNNERQYLLTDFGLAHPTMRIMSNQTMRFFQSIAGTPHYMPPEQIRGDWRDYGPWTDLYALGCVAYELCCHRTPFSGTKVLEVIKHHLKSPQPLWRPQVIVPQGFDRWIERMMQKHPFDRPERAADALKALLHLGDGQAYEAKTWSEVSESITMPTQQLSTLDLDAIRKVDQRADSVDMGSHSLNIWSPDDMVDATMEELAMSSEVSTHLHVVQQEDGQAKHIIPGLGLFGLRDIPLVGRQAHFSTLWSTLEHVAQTRHLRLATVLGPSGVGKTKLVSWLTQRADELGVATFLKLTVRKDEPMATSMRNMLQSRLRCQDLSFKETLDRVNHFLGHTPQTEDPQQQLQARALAQLMVDTDAKSTGNVHFANDRDRNLALLPALLKLSNKRPLILWVEDVEQNPQVLNTVYDLLGVDALHTSQILLVITSKNNTNDRELTFKLDALRQTFQSAETIEVDPLDDREMLHFVRNVLDFSPDTAKTLVIRSNGLPLMAMQTIKDWVSGSQLIHDDEGFRLLNPKRHTRQLSSLDDLWRARLETLASSTYPHMIEALELAAAHGHHVPNMSWTILCAKRRYLPIDGILDLLARQGFIDMTGNGFQFTQANLESYLEHSARQNNRWKDHHDLWANHMMTTPNANSTEWLLRLSHHLFHAEDYKRAADVSRDASRLFHEQSDYTSALDVLSRELACYDKQQRPANAPRRVAAMVFKAEILRQQGDYATSGKLLQQALQHTEQGTLVQADAFRLVAMLNLTGDNAQIVPLYIQQAHQIYQHHQHDEGLAKLYHTKGWYSLNQQLEDAFMAFEHAIQHAQVANDLMAEAWALQGQVEFHIRNLALVDAKKTAQRAMTIFGQTNSRAGTCLSLCNLAEIAMFEGKHDTMLRMATQGKDVAMSSGSVMVVYAELLRGLWATLRLDAKTAIRRLDRVIEQVPASIHYNIFIMSRLAKAMSMIQLNDFEACSRIYQDVIVHLNQRPAVVIHFLFLLHHTHNLFRPKPTPHEVLGQYVHIRDVMLRQCGPRLKQMARQYNL